MDHLLTSIPVMVSYDVSCQSSACRGRTVRAQCVLLGSHVDLAHYSSSGRLTWHPRPMVRRYLTLPNPIYSDKLCR